jgi:hypothetical protein
MSQCILHLMTVRQQLARIASSASMARCYTFLRYLMLREYGRARIGFRPVRR